MKISQYKIFKIGIDKPTITVYNVGEESERRQAGEARESKRSGAVPRMKRGRRKKSEEQADVLIYFDYAGLGIQMRRYNV